MDKNGGRHRGSARYALLKRGLDVLVALVALILLSPLMALVCAAIMLDSPGNPIYPSSRIGRYGRRFGMLKFRTLRDDADKLTQTLGLGVQIPAGDPRLTRLGSFLRRVKLNELPQLWNVLVGDISLVGPRPDVPDHLDLLEPEERAEILSVPQGIVDLATLFFHDMDELVSRGDAEEIHRTYVRPTKTRLQLLYVRKRSLLLDLQILTQLALTLLGKLTGLARNVSALPAELVTELSQLVGSDPHELQRVIAGTSQFANGSRQPSVALRRATPEDARLLFEWRNDPFIVARSSSQRTVTWEEHQAWLERTLSRSDRLVLVITEGQRELGQVRFEREGNQAVISVFLLQAHTGAGRGVEAIRLGCQQALHLWPDVETLVAHVRMDNLPGRKAFLRAGFSESTPTEATPREHFCLTLTRSHAQVNS